MKRLEDIPFKATYGDVPQSFERRVQYALWGLVALRLLLPVNLPATQYSGPCCLPCCWSVCWRRWPMRP